MCAISLAMKPPPMHDEMIGELVETHDRVGRVKRHPSNPAANGMRAREPAAMTI